MREQSYSNKYYNTNKESFRGGETKVMKKSLLSLLIFALIFTMAAPVFAAPASDVAGTEYEAAVNVLTTLGVVNGFPDGTYRPDDELTRAQFAKLVVEATGNGKVAEWLQGTEVFDDVKGSYWASGHIAAAVNLGLFQGRGDNQFAPNASVTQAEVVTVLLRAVGYDDSLPGNWPFDYVIQAEKDGLLSGVDFKVTGDATRGIAALFLNNGLDLKLVTKNEAGAFVKGSDSLFSELGLTTKTGVVVESKLNKDGELVLNNGNVKLASDAILPELSGLIGYNVEYILKDGKAVYVRAADAANVVVQGAVKTAVTDLVYGTEKIELTVGSETSKYDVATGFSFYKNGKFLTGTDRDLAAGATATLFLENDEVRFVLGKEYTHSGVLFDSYITKTAYRDAKVYFTATSGSVVLTDSTSVTINGDVATAADLKANDVLYIVANADGAVAIDAVRESVTGEITASKTVDSKTYYTVNGADYQLASGAVYLAADLAVSTEVTFYLDMDGKVKKVKKVSAASSASTKDAVILKLEEGKSVLVGEEVKTLDKVSYFDVASETDVTVYVDIAVFDGSSVNGGHVGHLVTLTFTDGEVTGVNHKSDFTAGAVSAVTSNSLTVAGNTHLVNADTIVLDVQNVGAATPSVSATTFSNITKDDTVALVLDGDGIYATYVALVTDNEASATTNLDSVTGLFVSSSKVETVTDTVYTVDLNVAGEVKTFNVDGVAYTDAGTTENAVVTLSDAGVASKVYDTASVTNKATSLTVSSTNETFTASSVSFISASSTNYYVIDKDGNVSVGTFTDLKEGATGILDTDVEVFVVDSGSDIGSYNVAGTVVIKKLK
jgi:hypothetical protein